MMRFKQTSVKVIAGEIIRGMEYLKGHHKKMDAREQRDLLTNLDNMVTALQDLYPYSTDGMQGMKEYQMIYELGYSIHRRDYEGVKKYAKTIIEMVG